MSLAALAYPTIIDTPDDFSVDAKVMNVNLRRAVARMTQFCLQSEAHARFMAKGLVLDTMGDVNKQIRSYFPAHINVSPILEDIAFVAGQAAKSSGQNYQELALNFIGDGKIPKQEQANKQFSVKWYSEDSVVAGGDSENMRFTLRPGGAGSAGGTGADMLRSLNLGSQKGFLLVISAVEADDIRVLELLGQAGMVQAFGHSPEAMEAMKALITQGGAEAALAEQIIQDVVESKSLTQALENATTPEQAEAISTALAIKTEAMSVSLPSLEAKLPAPVMQALSLQVDTVKTDLTARQIARVVERLDVLPINNDLLYEISQKVREVKSVALANNLNVHEMVTLSLTAQAPKPMIDLVKDFGGLMAKTPSLPAVERALPALAANIRADLITPALSRAASIKIAPALIVEALKSIKSPVALNAIAASISKLEAAALPTGADKKAVTADKGAALQIEQITNPIQIQSISENLQALQQSRNTPPEVKAQLDIIVPQIEALNVQTRMESLNNAAPAITAALSASSEPQAKLSQLANQQEAPRAAEAGSKEAPTSQAESISSKISEQKETLRTETVSLETPAKRSKATASKESEPTRAPHVEIVREETPVVQPKAAAPKENEPEKAPHAEIVREETPVVQPEAAAPKENEPAKAPHAEIVREETPVVQPEAAAPKENEPVRAPHDTGTPLEATQNNAVSPIAAVLEQGEKQREAADSLKNLAQQSNNPTIAKSVDILKNAETQAQQQEALRQIRDNLEAVAHMSSTPESVKAELKATVQKIDNAIIAKPDAPVETKLKTPEPVKPDSPLDILTDEKAKFVSPSPEEAKKKDEHWDKNPIPKEQPEKKPDEIIIGGDKPKACADKKCADCFNKCALARANEALERATPSQASYEAEQAYGAQNRGISNKFAPK